MKQLIILIATICFIQACKSTDTAPTPNRPPNAFTVKTTLKSDGKTIVLNWTKAKDPDGDVVTYSVVLKDTLAKKLTDTTFTISKLDYNYNQTGKVIAKDAKGLSSEATFTAITQVNTTFKILDTNFEKILVWNKLDKDGVVNGQMAFVDALKIDTLVVTQADIKTLSGIENFTNLKKLYCSFNQLTSLDVSKNINLTNLYCHFNPLTNIDLTKNINLIEFTCSNTSLTSIDFSKNSNLTLLYCDNNQLTSLDLSKNINLMKLTCANSHLNSLDVSKNTNLKILYCGNNSLKNLDLTKNVNLTDLDCNYNQMSILDLSKNINLTSLTCERVPLTSLDLTNNSKILSVTCINNQLKSLDLSKNISLKWLNCSYNQLSSLDISKNKNLISLSCHTNNIKTICVADVAKANTSGWQKDATAVYAVCN